MNLTVIDLAIVIAYFVVSAGIGFLFTKRGGESLSEYFLSGRAVPWWLAGASMVATTFAADTPLVVTGFVAANGVAGNWVWWCFVMSGMLTVFFFARLWRRAHVMTDIEFAEIRYSGRPVAYSVAAGMWAVLWTDLIQFIIKMTAVIVLAIFAVRAVGGIDALKAGLARHFGSEQAALSVLPISTHGGGVTAYAWLPLITIAWFLFVQWWAAWYPGAEPGGGGYVAQRIFSAKSERDGVLATLFFQVAHYALRPWPWILTGLATIILYPNGVSVAGLHNDREAAYVQAFVDLLPTPWRGFMMAGFAAAYMSTVATQLNWGASYLVNDVYRRFMRREGTESHYVTVSRWATIFLFLGSTFVSWQLSSVEQAWKFLLALGAGTGLVLILRWYWWRINAWSEISAMLASFVVSVLGANIVPGRFTPGNANADA